MKIKNDALKNNDDFIMLPTVDFCFKELMASDKVRRGFIAVLLKISPEEIFDTSLMEASTKKENKKDKLGILDVRVKLQDRTQLDIEMQVTFTDIWPERSLFYLCKMYTSQIKQGEDYEVLAKCVHVGILDFVLFADTDEFYSCFHLKEDNRGSQYTDKLEIQIIELPKLERYSQLEIGISKWAKFFSAKKKEEFEKMACEDEYLNEAYTTLLKLSADEEKRLEYEAREKALLDHRYDMKSAAKRGLKEGIEKGIEKGLEQGIETGRTAGVNQVNQLGKMLLADGRVEELLKSFEDEALQKELIKEYELE